MRFGLFHGLEREFDAGRDWDVVLVFFHSLDIGCLDVGPMGEREMLLAQFEKEGAETFVERLDVALNHCFSDL